MKLVTTAQHRIAVCEPYLGGREAEYVLDCLKTNWISSAGTYLTEFERAFARYCGAAEGIGTTSGTTALHLALAARGLGPGDEIIMPAFTIAATVFAALYVGATPVLRSEEHTSELQSRPHLVCRLLLEKKKI